MWKTGKLRKGSCEYLIMAMKNTHIHVPCHMQSSVSQLLIAAGFVELVHDLVAFVRTLGNQETLDVPSSHIANTTHAAVII